MLNIIISRSVFQNGVSMSTLYRSAETHLDNQGNIITSIGKPSEYAICCFPFRLKNIKWPLIILLIIWLAIVFVPHPFTKLPYILLMGAQAILSSIIILPVLITLFVKERKSSARYHTALHMVLNSYKNLGRIPTIDEAKEYSIIVEDCFIHKNLEAILRTTPSILLAFTINGVTSSLIVFLLFYCSWELFIFPRIKNKKFMQFFERLILVKPTDTELQVAIECLSFLADETSTYESNGFYVSHINPSPSSHN